MLFVRPARLADLDELERMARAAVPVLHSLPRDRRALETRVALSEDSFRAEVEFPGEEFYLFVLEDAHTGRLLGTSSIVASAGYSEPFYAFRNDALIHASRELKVNRKIHALTMSHELTGKSRLTGFYIDPSLRNEASEAAAHLLSRARMIYIAANRKRFSSEVFSLMLGVSDESGASPFWEAVGRKFFGRDFEQVEMESGGRSRTFIAEVMPSYPLYVPLLPGEAQRVLGEPNESTLLAYDIHLEEGFEPDRFVDIFDAGPVLTIAVGKSASAASGELRTVREAASESGAPYLVAAGGAHEFRCIVAALAGTRADGAALDPAARAALGVEDKDTVRCVPLHQASGELQ
ncbi:MULTISPECIES: arginine/ornithine succinyltransferase subunit alpha [Caballeronia]|uniref:Arginine N-succinyltransferase subunit alpha n=1 Tax=Caballeronia cordobensis TaxID=1353886 RepID=A0A158FJV4_CABCO|nr:MULTISPECIES: arginine/ornithine succinyltransferase subunit alpha [Caballeronia]AET88804.1 arginine N-succinyltransferase, alpha chain [Burkholderia sp. YI23]AQG98259.1 arginine/ornithine succinyltransferase subunit alpha [Burkholderia sp. KK1]BAO86053.1 arginine N-succinyltransferase, alpha chain [Burkholderia sp. RPE67]BBP95869.1 arginine N-succinyltransferase subunit alpha [Burkholderia sp. SFA1]MCE4542175.1 arginine/ornithine succinyltransferase subunit alpha [Caballeronia sp. PC1]